MLTFTLAISCLTTSSLPQRGPNSLGYYAIFFFTASDFTFTTRHTHSWASFLLWPNHFVLSEAISNCPLFFPSGILHIFWPGDSSSFSVISFCLFILFMGFSWQEYWSGSPFPPPEDNILSELFTITCPSWVARHGIAHSFIELCKSLSHSKTVLREGTIVYMCIHTHIHTHISVCVCVCVCVCVYTAHLLYSFICQ